jgi:hypothetical protein
MRLVLTLKDAEAEGLSCLADREDRTPQQQAVRLLRQALVDAGVLEGYRSIEDEAKGHPELAARGV